MKTKFNHNTLKRAIVSAIVLMSAILGPHSNADRVTAMMNVSVSVSYSCSINAAPMQFGTYDGVGANASSALEATATIISTCSSGATAIITMNAGTSAGSGLDDAPVRRMAAGADEYLIYQIYSDVARETVWGNNVPTGIAINGIGSPQTHKLYGSIPSAQMVPEGDYSDQIYITVTY
ncbi:spore coat protein U domain-containing protein [Amylibacter sp.]|nr:spore coat protein U domain-containing protein [Amylibacter sp.]